MINPLISIVTVVYNSGSLIENTIKSVINQDYKHIQYIIIDGGSTDNTKDIILKYKEKIDVFISEPDSGIYNAMNKALKYVKGDFVNFMNAGDLFFDDKIIGKIFNHQQNNILDDGIIYGNHIVMYEKKEILKVPRSLKLLWMGMTIQHQSIFVSSKVFETEIFNEKYKFAADFDLFYKCYKQDLKIVKSNESISKVTPGGFSESNSVKTYLEFMNVTFNYEKSILIKLYYCYIIPKIYLVSLIKKVL